MNRLMIIYFLVNLRAAASSVGRDFDVVFAVAYNHYTVLTHPVYLKPYLALLG